MRLTGLLALLLFLLLVFFAAPAASYAQTASTPAAKTESTAGSDVSILPDQPQLKEVRPVPDSSEADHELFLSQPLVEHDGDLVLRRSLDRDFERDSTCYTMRTYVVAREDKTSDVTRMVHYQKCLPSWKIDLREAIAPVKSGLKR